MEKGQEGKVDCMELKQKEKGRVDKKEGQRRNGVDGVNYWEGL